MFDKHEVSRLEPRSLGSRARSSGWLRDPLNKQRDVLARDPSVWRGGLAPIEPLADSPRTEDPGLCMYTLADLPIAAVFPEGHAPKLACICELVHTSKPPMALQLFVGAVCDMRSIQKNFSCPRLETRRPRQSKLMSPRRQAAAPPRQIQRHVLGQVPVPYPTASSSWSTQSFSARRRLGHMGGGSRTQS